MQEYWINVYVNPFNKQLCIGQDHTNKDYCIKSSLLDDWKTAYRLHIKVGAKSSRSFYPYVWKDGKSAPNKPLYIQTIGRAKRPVKILYKLDWMDRFIK